MAVNMLVPRRKPVPVTVFPAGPAVAANVLTPNVLAPRRKSSHPKPVPVRVFPAGPAVAANVLAPRRKSSHPKPVPVRVFPAGPAVAANVLAPNVLAPRRKSSHPKPVVVNPVRPMAAAPVGAVPPAAPGAVNVLVARRKPAVPKPPSKSKSSSKAKIKAKSKSSSKRAKSSSSKRAKSSSSKKAKVPRKRPMSKCQRLVADVREMARVPEAELRGRVEAALAEFDRVPVRRGAVAPGKPRMAKMTPLMRALNAEWFEQAEPLVAGLRGRWGDALREVVQSVVMFNRWVQEMARESHDRGDKRIPLFVPDDERLHELVKREGGLTEGEAQSWLSRLQEELIPALRADPILAQRPEWADEVAEQVEFGPERRRKEKAEQARAKAKKKRPHRAKPSQVKAWRQMLRRVWEEAGLRIMSQGEAFDRIVEMSKRWNELRVQKGHAPLVFPADVLVPRAMKEWGLSPRTARKWAQHVVGQISRLPRRKKAASSHTELDIIN